MNRFKEAIKAKNKRAFYKTYEKGEDDRKIYKGSIASKERKEYLYLATVTCFVMDENGKVLVEKRGKAETEPGELDLVSRSYR